MNNELQALAENPGQTVSITLTFIVGVIVLGYLGADELAQDIVSIFGLFLLAGTVGTLLLLVKLVQNLSGSGQRARA